MSIRIGRIALAFLVLALAAGSVAIPASADHGGAVVAKSKCKKKAKRASAAKKKKKKCKRGGTGAGGAATSLPGQAAHPTVTPPVTTPAIHMSALALTDNPVLGGRVTQGQVTISGLAPSAGQPVTLVSTDPRVSVPGAVNVAAGLTKATFPVTTSAGPTVTVPVTASIGASSKQVFLKVVQEPSVKSVSLAYKCFPDVGLVDFGTNRVTLDVPAAADSPVDLTSSDPLALTTVPSTVTVQAGSSSATFGVNTFETVPPPGLTVTGSLTGAFGKTQATSAPSSIRDDSSAPSVVVGISATPTNVAPSSSVTGRVTLDCEAPDVGTTVTLSSNNAGVTVPATVDVPADALNVTFPITAAADASGTATITATPDGGTPEQVTVTVDSTPV